jgi:hypothetical protein
MLQYTTPPTILDSFRCGLDDGLIDPKTIAEIADISHAEAMREKLPRHRTT